MKKNEILICEVFYSIQGEGRNIGKPVVFVRTAGCNLRCNKASSGFDCDTQYSYTGELWNIEKVVDEIKKYNCKHIVFTGGEPLVQAESIARIINELGKNYEYEFETNGTISPKVFDEYVGLERRNFYWNVSPKKHAVDIDVLKEFSFCWNTSLKLVITDEDMWKFWKENVITRLSLDNDHIYLMPEGVTRDEILHNSEFVVDICKKEGVNFSSRLHILIWDKKRAV